MKKKVDLSGEKNIPVHVVAVFGIVQKGDKYLIAKRSASDPQAGGTWSVPMVRSKLNRVIVTDGVFHRKVSSSLQLTIQLISVRR